MCILAALPGSVLALSTDREQPIHIEADQASIDDLRGVTVYRGNVKVTQGTIRLQADMVTLTYNAAEKQLEAIIAEGKPARYRQRPDNKDADIHAEAERVEFQAGKDMLHLSGNAKIRQGEDVFTGKQISYDAKHSVIKATEKVTVILHPKKNKSSD
ncbi:MAG: lipopolysaccharide transport periplasmic protein LptA [Gammaproteobacteria bacterium]|nr:lipopolysaccharide transport periplasmic protein LptA [Gammaproteobacteria bacterium]